MKYKSLEDFCERNGLHLNYKTLLFAWRHRNRYPEDFEDLATYGKYKDFIHRFSPKHNK